MRYRTLFYIIVVSVMLVYKLCFKASSWSSCCMSCPLGADSQLQIRINAFLRRSKWCGFCWRDLLTFEELLENSNGQLFNIIINNIQHVVYCLLPPPSAASQHCQHRQQTHNLQLPEHTGRLTDSNFLTRMSYRDSYWLYKVLFPFSTICILKRC